ncbi:MAG: hypothetical protein RLZZ298_554 [Pseudomonadota bacterium]|jgi:hypothetical protein
MNRRNLLALLATSLSTVACSNNLALKTAGTIIESSLGNGSAFEPDYPDKLPYATIAVRQKGRPRSLLILGRVSGDELQWVSADRGMLITRHGRLIRTVGFTDNLNKTDFVNSDYFDGTAQPALKTEPANRLIDLSPGNRYGIKIESSLEKIGLETIEIGKHRYETTRYDETCFSSLIGWKYTNSFWVDSQGRIWRSTQHFTPKADPLTIELTKHYQPS